MFNLYIYQPILRVLTFLAQTMGGNLGLAIIALTVLLRAMLVPITMPSLRSAQKLRDLKPELDKLKERFGKDKLKLQQAQLELYKQHGLNPAAGCLPNIAQLVILIALYRVFMNSLTNGALVFSTHFLWLDLAKPDPLYVMPVLAALSQLVFSLMLTPALEHHVEKPPEKTEGVQDMAETMQQQMVLIMPVMTGLIALSFPAGLTLYWIVTTVFSLGQQYVVSGWGGLPRYVAKFSKLPWRK